jgi:uncharacterized protein
MEAALSRLAGGSAPACLLVFTKPAVPGRVKTRLIGALTPVQAADLHAAFLADLLARLQGPASFELAIAWSLVDDEPLPPSRWPALRQEGSDLGERLYNGLAGAAARHSFVAAIGSDHPDLPRERVEEAFALLAEGADVVFGPATDGGYYLVGVRREALSPELFTGIPWSTSEVLGRTLERCRDLRLSPVLLAAGEDVDTPADLARLAAALRRDGSTCPRTAALLAAWEAVAPLP